MDIQEYKTKDEFRIRLEARLKNAELFKARESLGLSIEEAAEGMGLSPTTLCGFENLKSYPSQESKEKIVDFYRKKGYFILEEDVFPQELRNVKARKLVAEKEIPKEKLVSLNYVNPKLLPINYNTPREELDEKILGEELPKLMDSLTEREAGVLEYRFGLKDGKPITLEETGKIFSINKERVRQIEAKALRKLRHPSKLIKLREFVLK